MRFQIRSQAGQCARAPALPISIKGDSRKGAWKIWVRWPYCWPFAWLSTPLASVVGRIKRKPFLIVSGERAVYSVWALITIGSGILVYALVTGDFRFSYVAEHSNRAMPLLYKFAAWWGGQEGSLLFWSWLLSTYAPWWSSPTAASIAT
jgi:hypothetical protein